MDRRGSARVGPVDLNGGGRRLQMRRIRNSCPNCRLGSLERLSRPTTKFHRVYRAPTITAHQAYIRPQTRPLADLVNTSTMPTLSEVFRTIHRLRRHTRELQTEIDRAPMQLKARQTFAAKQAKALLDAREALKKNQVAVREREADLKASHELVARYRKQVNDVTDKKQYDALKHEISEAEARLAQLEEVILNGMALADEQTGQIAAADESAKKAQRDLDGFEAEQKARHALLAEELKSTLAQITAAEANIPDDVKPEYARRIASYGPDGLAAVENNCCSFCRTGITAQNRIQLARDTFLTCTSCFRALYLTEGVA